MGRKRKVIEPLNDVLEEKEEEKPPILENIEEIKAEEPVKKEAPKPVKKANGLPLVPLKVFCALSGKKWDQIAGFKSQATKDALKPMTMPEWKVKYQEFMDTPVK